MVDENKAVKTVTMNVSIEFKEFLDHLKNELEDYLWDSAKLSYADLSRILIKKINAKQIKI